MCTYNGEKYLNDQLISISNQSTELNLKLFISDDGSIDNTLNILRKFKYKRIPTRIIERKGPHGFSSNFAFLTAKKNIKADFYAWSDQDDIWLKNKLERAVSTLKSINTNIPAVYSSRTIITDEFNNKIGESKIFKKPYIFQNALVQSVAGGNTMVFNEAARILFNKAARSGKISSHDWLMYIVTTGCGGIFICDQNPSVRYRQHNKNLIGTNITFKSMFGRVASLFKENLKNSISSNENSISLIEKHLTKKNKSIYFNFYNCRNNGPLIRLKTFIKLKIFRQGLAENFLFYIAVLLNKT